MIDIREAFQKYQHYTYEVEYRDGFIIVVRPTSPALFRKIAKECTRVVINPKTRQAEEKIDEELNRRKLVEHIIADWRGLTANKIRQWYVGIPLEPSDEEIPYSIDTALALMDYMMDFERFLVDITTGAYQIEAERRVELKENFL